jgi:hypothetical protein
MKKNNQHFRILAIAPSSKGFGFAVLEGQDNLVDWGVKIVTGDKNVQSIAKVKENIIRYQPDILVFEDALANDSRRSPRIRTLHQQILKLAAQQKVPVKLFPREQVMNAFITDGEWTRHTLAETIAQRFPEKLTTDLPPKRKPWMSEDAKIDIFVAVALALTFRLKQAKNES